MAQQLWGNALPEQNLPRLPNLEPDEFWFILRVSNMESPLKEWLSAMQTEDPVNWAQISAKLEYAKYFERDNSFVESARQHLGISNEELDSLWMYGAS